MSTTHASLWWAFTVGSWAWWSLDLPFATLSLSNFHWPRYLVLLPVLSLGRVCQQRWVLCSLVKEVAGSRSLWSALIKMTDWEVLLGDLTIQLAVVPDQHLSNWKVGHRGSLRDRRSWIGGGFRLDNLTKRKSANMQRNCSVLPKSIAQLNWVNSLV